MRDYSVSPSRGHTCFSSADDFATAVRPLALRSRGACRGGLTLDRRTGEGSVFSFAA